MSTLLIASTGGHLEELVDIAARLPDHDERLWVTHENPQSRSLLADAAVVFIPYIGVKDVPGVVRSIPVAHRLFRKHRFDGVVSTGSGIALAFLPYLAARGVPAHYIELSARVDGPSLSGRLLRFAPGVHLYTQYLRWASGPWRYGGSVFDGFSAVESRALRPIRQVVVTVGTAHEFPFRRLLDVLVPLLGPGGALEREQAEPVQTLWQTGCTPSEGLNIALRPWLSAAELADAMVSADLIVSHAGCGSALVALKAGHCPVLVPRESAKGEIGDDHQRQLAHHLASRGLAIYRRIEEISVSDFILAARRRVERAADPPAFDLTH
jgi:UDP-N-acetylglucosamine--N-acetylmuramyl-(pentapeptide) pyrophosphoryl-undecaprenol N-acetylglucosamine transferase